MVYHIDIDRIKMELSILYFKGLPVFFYENGVFLSLKTVFILANGAYPKKCRFMRHFIWVFTVCQYLFTGVKNLKGSRSL